MSGHSDQLSVNLRRNVGGSNLIGSLEIKDMTSGIPIILTVYFYLASVKYCLCVCNGSRLRYCNCSLLVASTTLGYTRLKPEQKCVIEAFLKGRDVIVSVSTGSGKSLCYALLPAAFDFLRDGERSIVILVSPLLEGEREVLASLNVPLPATPTSSPYRLTPLSRAASSELASAFSFCSFSSRPKQPR